MLHNMERPYPCTECQKSFRSSNNLREHLRIHTGERPYKCRVCEQTFTTSGTRGRHEKIHGAALILLKIGKKRYSCTRCSEHFSGAVARIKHMKKSHSLTSQYFCIRCDIELESVEELLEHHSTVHSADSGKTSGVSTLTAEHEDHAYHRCPSNDTNAMNRESLDSEGAGGSLVSKRSKSYSRIQRRSLLKLRSICLKARKRNVGNGSEFVCRYCGERFSKLPLFLKHLWKHSNAKSKMMVESVELIKNEIVEEKPEADIITEGEITGDSHRLMMSEEVEVVEGSDIIVESEFLGSIPDAMISVLADVIGQSNVITKSEIMDSSMMAPSETIEPRNEGADTRYLAEAKDTSDETRNLQHFVEEFVLCKYRYELQEDEQIQVKAETFSPGKNQLLDHPVNLNSGFNESNHGSVTHDPGLNKLGDAISPNDNGDISRITADNKNSVYDERVCHNNNNNNTGNLFLEVHPNVTESSPENIGLETSVSISSVQHIPCELCGKRVKGSDEIEASDESVYTCVECDQLFSSLQQLQDGSGMDALESLSHDVQDGMKRKQKRTPAVCRKKYSCCRCNVKFNTRKMCSLHEKTCTVDKTLSECKDSSVENSTPDRQKPTVPYSCTVCSRPFAFKYRLQRHMLTHTGERPFKCKECGKSYTSNEYLKSHYARHFSEFTHLCSTCGKSFADRLAWRLHKRVHEIAKRTKSLPFREYMCWLCGFQFRHASNLTKHMQRHRLKDKYPYKCGECDQKFRTKEGVRFHVGTHALDKPYLCMECPKAFPDSWCLKIHSRSHTKLGSFDCGVCGKKYRTMSSLRTHSRHHMDMRYVCDICGETFGFSRKYRSHLIKHRPPFQCDVCGVTTTRAAGLRKHKKRFQHFQ